VSGFKGKMISLDPIDQEASTDWVKRGLQVPCPACGGRLLVPDMSTDFGRIGALHEAPTCKRFDRLVSRAAMPELAAFLRELADKTTEGKA
jgi:hypothetical protein